MGDKWYVIRSNINMPGNVFYQITQATMESSLLEFDVTEGSSPLFAAAAAITAAGLDTVGLHIRYAD